MGCNCNKQPTYPTGWRPVSRSQQEQQRNGTPTVDEAAKPASFTLLTASGERQVFGSRLEAEAARVRLGAGSILPST